MRLSASKILSHCWDSYMSTCDHSPGRVFRAFVALAFVMVSGTAFASQSYPGELQSQLDMECAPTCTLCHQDQNGGAGTATKPFAEALIDNGLKKNDEASLRAAIEAADGEGVDTDGDGVVDIEELREGPDPNVSGAVPLCGPQYGCGAQVSKRGEVDPPALLAALCVAGSLIFLGRRRRRSP